MRIYLECIQCIVRQAVEALEMSTPDTKLKDSIIREVLQKLSEIPFDKTPAHMGVEVHRIIKSRLGIRDPYRELKATYNRKALKLFPAMKEIVLRSKHPLETAVRLSIAGNTIDFGFHITNATIPLEEIIEDTLKRSFKIDHLKELSVAIDNASQILYLADNAKEIVFDRLLIEEIKGYSSRVLFAVKGHPIINDATIEDVRETGLTEIVRIITTGSDAPGTILETCNEKFINEFKRSDLIIAKGQSNYETLSDRDHNIFFLLKAKCPAIAYNLDVAVGDIIVKSGGKR